MKRSCLLVLSLLIVILAGRPTTDASADPTAPILVGGGLCDSATMPSCRALPSTPLMLEVPEKHLQVVYHKVKVMRPVTQTYVVTEKRPRKVVRQVYKKHTRIDPHGQMMLMPVKVRENCVRMRYEERKHTVLESRPMYIAEKTREVQTRQLYREVKHPHPKKVLSYVPVKTTQMKTCQVYVEEKIPMMRMVSEIRMVPEESRDLATGKVTIVRKPVCQQRQVTEMVKRHVLREETRPTTVTDYRLEERPDLSHKQFVCVWEQVMVPVTKYRCEMRLQPRESKEYVLVPRHVEEMVTRYEMRPGPKKIDEYVLLSEEAIINETTYRCETRTDMREVEITVPCVGEVIVLVSKPQAMLTGAAAHVQDGRLTAFGAISHAPSWR